MPIAGFMPVQVADSLKSNAARSAFVGFVGVSEVGGLPEVCCSDRSRSLARPARGCPLHRKPLIPKLLYLHPARERKSIASIRKLWSDGRQ